MLPSEQARSQATKTHSRVDQPEGYHEVSFIMH